LYLQSLKSSQTPIMDGDVNAVLKWPDIWVPTYCRMFRYNVGSIFKYLYVDVCTCIMQDIITYNPFKFYGSWL
jgi:hypothetical protein